MPETPGMLHILLESIPFPRTNRDCSAGASFDREAVGFGWFGDGKQKSEAKGQDGLIPLLGLS